MLRRGARPSAVRRKRSFVRAYLANFPQPFAPWYVPGQRPRPAAVPSIYRQHELPHGWPARSLRSPVAGSCVLAAVLVAGAGPVGAAGGGSYASARRPALPAGAIVCPTPMRSRASQSKIILGLARHSFGSPIFSLWDTPLVSLSKFCRLVRCWHLECYNFQRSAF